VYLFSTIRENRHVYVGRTGNLPIRIGEDHRSKDAIAQVTHAIKLKYHLVDMAQAREKLFRNYQVRMLVEPDVGTRAMLEVYVAIKLDTEFNRLDERRRVSNTRHYR
jgi:hypothetical protein